MPSKSASAVAAELQVVKSTVTRAAQSHGIGTLKTDLSGRSFWSFTERDVERLKKLIRVRPGPKPGE